MSAWDYESHHFKAGIHVHETRCVRAPALCAGLRRGADPATPTGRWLAEDIDGGGVIDRLQTTLEILDDGIVNGMGGCNRYAGSVTVSGNTIKFLPMASTRMACSAAVMRQEAKFHSTLEKVRTWRIDQAQRKLLLLDSQGFDLMRLSRMD